MINKMFVSEIVKMHDLSYQIQFHRTNTGWNQRHVWVKENGTTILDHWICSPFSDYYIKSKYKEVEYFEFGCK